MVCIDMRLIQIQRQQWPSSEISSEIRAIFLEENIPFDFDAINTLISNRQLSWNLEVRSACNSELEDSNFRLGICCIFRNIFFTLFNTRGLKR